MVFVVDAFGTWLVEVLAEAGRRRLTTWTLGTDQDRALQQAATAAVRRTAEELFPEDARRAEGLMMTINQVFSEPMSGLAFSRQPTLLQALQEGVADKLAVLSDASLTGTRESSLEVLGLSGAVLVTILTRHLFREVLSRAAHGGPLTSLAAQLNSDVTHLQGQRLEGMVGQLAQETSQILAHLAASGDRLPAVHPEPAGLARRTWHARLPRWTNDYVRRADLHDQLKELVKSTGRSVLVGLPGFGKTRLAREVAVELADEMHSEVLWLRGESEDSMLLDMNSELLERDVAVEQDASRLIREFSTLIDLRKPTPVVVIDGLEDSTILERAFPRHSGASLIVTMRQRLLDEAVWPYIEVDEMPMDEAVKLAQAQLPIRFGASDAQRLAEALAGYPLAILHSAALISHAETMSIDQFCMALERDASGTFDSRIRRERALTFIYRMMLARIAQEHAQAADLLMSIALLGRAQVPRGLAQLIFSSVRIHRSGGNESFTNIEFTNAVETLEGYVLLSSSSAHREYQIHQLVQALLRSLTIKSGRSDILRAVTDGLNRWLSSSKRTTDAISPWTSTIIALIEENQEQRPGDNHTLRMGELLATVMTDAVSHGDQHRLAAAKRSWLYQWIVGCAGSDNRTAAYVQYTWLRLADGEYEPFALIKMAERSRVNEPSSYAFKAATSADRDWRPRHEEALRGPASSPGSARVLEPLPDAVRVAREMLMVGNYHEAEMRSSSALASAALVGSPDQALRLNSYIALSQVRLRRLDIDAARHHIEEAQELLSASAEGKFDPFQRGRICHVLGDIEHIGSHQGKGSMHAARQNYEQARSLYWLEPIPISGMEVERKLACVAAYSNKEHAAARLRNLMLKCDAPLHLPTYYRTRLSLAKVAILLHQASLNDFEDCWLAGDFYASSSTRDRYWYLESMITAFRAGECCGAPDSEMALLRDAVVREGKVLGREDKIAFAKTLGRRRSFTAALAD